jgi:predicted amidohydrolase
VYVASLCSGLDRAANRDAALAGLEEAATAGARLAVLPEYTSVFDPRGTSPAEAEPLDGPFLQAVGAVARARGLVVVVGTLIPGSSGDRAVNAVAVLDGGVLVGVYRKVHLYDAFGHRESDRLESGAPDQAAVVVDVDGLRVGVMTCYDLRFPESARRLADAGATLLVVPAAWASGEHKSEQWRLLLRARAVEDVAYVVGSVQRGAGVTGEALAVDPWGVVLAEGRGGPVVVDLDPDAVVRARERNPSLLNRRYDVVPRG